MQASSRVIPPDTGGDPKGTPRGIKGLCYCPSSSELGFDKGTKKCANVSLTRLPQALVSPDLPARLMVPRQPAAPCLPFEKAIES